MCFRNKLVYPSSLLRFRQNISIDDLAKYPKLYTNFCEIITFGADGNFKLVELDYQILPRMLTTAQMTQDHCIVPLFHFLQTPQPGYTVTHEQYYYIPDWHDWIASKEKGKLDVVPLSDDQQQDAAIIESIHTRHSVLQSFGVKITPIISPYKGNHDGTIRFCASDVLSNPVI